MKDSCTLSTVNVHDTLEKFREFLERDDLETSRVQSSLLLCEELMLYYQSELGEDAIVEYKTKRTSEYLRINLSFAGESHDPNAEDNLVVYRNILAQSYEVPEWSYDGTSNNIVLNLELNNTFKKDLSFAWQYTKRKKYTFFGAVILQLIATVFGIISAVLAARIIKNFTESAVSLALMVAAAIFICNIIEQVNNYIVLKLYNKVAYSTLECIQKDLAASVLSVRSATMNTYGSGYFIQRMSTDTATFAAGLNTVMDLLIQIGSFVGTLIAICIVDKYMFFYELLALALYYVVQCFGASRMIDTDRVARKANDRYYGFITELVHGFTDIKTLNCEGPVNDELEARVVDASAKQNTHTLRIYFYRMILNVLSAGSTFFFVYLLCAYLFTDTMDPATIVILYSYNARLGPAVITTINRFSEFYSKFRLSCERINSVMHSNEFPKERFGTVHKDHVEGKVEFDNVSFSYRYRKNEFFVGRKVLDGISFTVNPKHMAAFVGSSGCGKSTLFRLLDKLYTPSKGVIKIDDTDVDVLDKESLRGSMTIINQNPYIFQATIRENLKFVKPDLTDEQMIDVCKAACIHDDIMNMENGYDTMLGEGGVDISGGQKQRLAIARGLLCDTGIFILDEATSALDNNTQNEVLKAIDKLCENHTVMVIAHRLSTIIKADVIFYIKDGKVYAQGTHAELMEKCDEYKNLYLAEAKETDKQL